MHVTGNCTELAGSSYSEEGEPMTSRQEKKDKEAKKLKNGLFKRGVVVTRGDSHRGHNEGLSPREIKALKEENSSPWGQSMFRTGAIKDRAEKARRRR